MLVSITDAAEGTAYFQVLFADQQLARLEAEHPLRITRLDPSDPGTWVAYLCVPVSDSVPLDPLCW